MQQHRGGIFRQPRIGIHTVQQETVSRFILLPFGQSVSADGFIQSCVHHAVKHFVEIALHLILLLFRDIGRNKFVQSQIAFLCKDVQRVFRSQHELFADFGRRVFGCVGNQTFAPFPIFQKLAQCHESVHFPLFVQRNTQPAVLLLQTAARAGNPKIILFLQNRQHIVFIFDRLPCRITNAVHDGRTNIGVFLTFLSNGADIVQRGFQTFFPFRTLAHVLHIHRSKLIKFKTVFMPADIQRELPHGCCLQYNRFARSITQIPRLECQIRTAVGKTRLINRDAVQGQRMVHADGPLEFLTGCLVRYFNITGKIARHTGIVKVDMKFFQFDFKRQVLNQHPVVSIQENHIRTLPFGNIDVAPK